MLTNQEWKLRMAKLALEAKAREVLDPTYAASAAAARAKFVTIDDEGNVDAGTLTAQYAAIMREAPPKMRNDYTSARTGDPEFYNELRAIVAARHAAKEADGVGAPVQRTTGGHL